MAVGYFSVCDHYAVAFDSLHGNYIYKSQRILCAARSVNTVLNHTMPGAYGVTVVTCHNVCGEHTLNAVRNRKVYGLHSLKAQILDGVCQTKSSTHSLTPLRKAHGLRLTRSLVALVAVFLHACDGSPPLARVLHRERVTVIRAGYTPARYQHGFTYDQYR